MRKSNEEVKAMILNRLAEVEFTHTYAFAIRDEKMVKAVVVENADEVLPLVTYCERNAESHGAVWGVRMLNSRATFETLKEYANAIIPLCTINEFENRLLERRENGIKENRGNLFEVYFSEMTGGIMNENKSAKCTECGDVVVNGVHIQCKLWNATITTEPQVNRFYAKYLAKKNNEK